MKIADGYLARHRVVLSDTDMSAAAATTLREAGAEVDVGGPVDGLFGIHPTGIGVSVYAELLWMANRAVSVLADDPQLPPWPLSTRFAASPEPVVAVPNLPGLEDAGEQLAAAGAEVLPYDVTAGSATVGEYEAILAPIVERSDLHPLLATMCGVSVPRFGGMTVLTGAHHDAAALDIAAMLADIDPLAWVWPYVAADSVDLVVFGAHLRGEPLEYQLTDLGARWDGEVQTAPRYQMTVLATQPPKPGVQRVVDGKPGMSLAGHRWTLSPAALGIFLAQLPAPMQLGQVELDDGSWLVGFGCDASAATGPDISAYGGWLHAMDAGAVS